MTAATYTVPTIFVVVPIAVVICLPVWLASKWVSDRLSERVQRHYDAKIAALKAQAAEQEPGE